MEEFSLVAIFDYVLGKKHLRFLCSEEDRWDWTRMEIAEWIPNMYGKI